MNSKYSILIILFLTVFIVLYLSSNPLQIGLEEKSAIKEIYYVDNISKAHQKVIDLFNKEHEGKIRVIPIDIPFYKFSTNERKELLMRALRVDSERIDVFAADLIWVNRFSKWAEPLQNFLTEEEISKFFPKSLQTGYIGNDFIASPLYLDVSLMYYREDLLKKIPGSEKFIKSIEEGITWEDFIKFGKSANQKNDFYYFPADEYEGLICSFAELLLSEDSVFFDKKINLISKAAYKSTELLVNLVNKYSLSPKEVVNFRENTTYSSFFNNNGIFLRGWQSFENDSKNLVKSPLKEKFIKTANLPYFAGTNGGNTIGGWSLILSKNSENKFEAAEFIKFTHSVKAQKIFFSDGAYLPVINEIYQDSIYCKEHPSLLRSNKILQKGIFRPKLPEYTIISDIISHYLRLAIADSLTVKEALEKAQNKIDKIKQHF